MKTEIHVKNAPQTIGPYSQGVKADKTVYVSGQLPVDYKTGELGKNITEQTTLVFKNMQAVLAGAGMSLDNIVKTTVFMADLDDFGVMNEIYESFLKKPYPARSTIQVAKLPKGALLEIECIARS